MSGPGHRGPSASGPWLAFDSLFMGMAILQLFGVSNLSFWISKASCFIPASCAHIGWALHKFKKHHLAIPLWECQSLSLCSIHLIQL